MGGRKLADLEFETHLKLKMWENKNDKQYAGFYSKE